MGGRVIVRLRQDDQLALDLLPALSVTFQMSRHVFLKTALQRRITQNVRRAVGNDILLRHFQN